MIKFDLAKWRQNQITETVKRGALNQNHHHHFHLYYTLDARYLHTHNGKKNIFRGLLFLKIYSVIAQVRVTLKFSRFEAFYASATRVDPT